ncbi:MAG: leucine-rich repeat protein [bacterium]
MLRKNNNKNKSINQKNLMIGVMGISMLATIPPTSMLAPISVFAEDDILADFSGELVEVDGITGGKIGFDSATGMITFVEPEVTYANIPATINGVNVTSIDELAFQFCENLTSLTLPSTMEAIAYNSFQGTSTLYSITVDEDNPYFSATNGVLFNKDFTKLVSYPAGNPQNNFEIPETVTEIGDYAFSDVSDLTTVKIPNSVTTIGSWVFNNAHDLTSIQIPNSVTSIGYGLFANCSSLTNVVLPNSISTITDYLFYGCSSLASISIPDSITTIGNAVFYKCASLTSLEIPHGVTTIGNLILCDSVNVNTLSIPTSVTSIGDAIAFNADTFSSILYAGTEEQWSAIQIAKDNNNRFLEATITYNNQSSTTTPTTPDVSTNTTYNLPFTDIPTSADYVSQLEYLYNNEIINGTTDTTFSPSDTMTRAMLVVMLYRMEGSPEVAHAGFSDVSESDWYSSDISWAKENGIVNGTTDTTFSPNNSLTKEQVVAIIDRYYEYKGYQLANTKEGSIADSGSVSSWFQENISNMYQLGILNTDASNNFNPQDNATRSDVAYMLGELLLKVN